MIKCTPKQFAARIIESDLELVIGYWAERVLWSAAAEEMTDKERAEVQEQLEKYYERITRMVASTAEKAEKAGV